MSAQAGRQASLDTPSDFWSDAALRIFLGLPRTASNQVRAAAPYDWLGSSQEADGGCDESPGKAALRSKEQQRIEALQPRTSRPHRDPSSQRSAQLAPQKPAPDDAPPCDSHQSSASNHPRSDALSPLQQRAAALSSPSSSGMDVDEQQIAMKRRNRGAWQEAAVRRLSWCLRRIVLRQVANCLCGWQRSACAHHTMQATCTQMEGVVAAAFMDGQRSLEGHMREATHRIQYLEQQLQAAGSDREELLARIALLEQAQAIESSTHIGQSSTHIGQSEDGGSGGELERVKAQAKEFVLNAIECVDSVEEAANKKIAEVS